MNALPTSTECGQTKVSMHKIVIYTLCGNIKGFNVNIGSNWIVYLSGDYSLQIQPVVLGDDALFQCQVSAIDGIPGIFALYACIKKKLI